MPAEPRRIEPAKIPEMYRRLGMIPITNRVGAPDENCGCLLGCLARYEGVGCQHDLTSDAVENLIGRGWNLSYVDGLWQGFDDKPNGIVQFYGCDSRMRQIGYRDGLAARRALIVAGMMDGPIPDATRKDGE
jgi:hypothetical protein